MIYNSRITGRTSPKHTFPVKRILEMDEDTTRKLMWRNRIIAREVNMISCFILVS